MSLSSALDIDEKSMKARFYNARGRQAQRSFDERISARASSGEHLLWSFSVCELPLFVTINKAFKTAIEAYLFLGLENVPKNYFRLCVAILEALRGVLDAEIDSAV